MLIIFTWAGYIANLVQKFTGIGQFCQNVRLINVITKLLHRSPIPCSAISISRLPKAAFLMFLTQKSEDPLEFFCEQMETVKCQFKSRNQSSPFSNSEGYSYGQMTSSRIPMNTVYKWHSLEIGMTCTFPGADPGFSNRGGCILCEHIAQVSGVRSAKSLTYSRGPGPWKL